MKKKHTRAFTALALSLVMALIVGVLPTATVTNADPVVFNDGAKMSDLLFQFYVQDGADNNHLWHDYKNTNPVYNQEESIVWDCSSASTSYLECMDTGVTFGFQMANSKLEAGETASCHYIIKDIVITFKTYETVVIDEVFEEEAYWEAFEASWGGLSGMATAVHLNDYLTQAEVGVMVKDIQSISFTMFCDYLEYDTEGPRGSGEAVVNDLAEKLGTGITISNALDQATSTGDEITKAMIKAYAKAGYKTVRIPVCFDGHTGAAPDYKIDKTYLVKIGAVIDLALKENMYVILSVEGLGGWMDPTADNATNGQKRLTKIWETLAKEFAEYDERLMFETMCTPNVSTDTMGKEDYFNTVNTWNAACVRAIREAGEENETRAILLPSYNATYAYASKMTFPDDSNIILSVSMNVPFAFAYSVAGNAEVEWNTAKDTQSLRTAFTDMLKHVDGKNIPIIVTECGAANKDNYEARMTYTYDVMKLAKEMGIVCLWNDTGIFEPSKSMSYGLLNRETAEWVFPSIVEAAIAGNTWDSLPEVEGEPNYPADMSTQAPETEAPTAGEQAPTQAPTQPQTPSDDKENSNTKVIITVVVAVIIFGALIAVIIMFKRQNGSFF